MAAALFGALGRFEAGLRIGCGGEVNDLTWRDAA
jgi:hypothetical protein